MTDFKETAWDSLSCSEFATFSTNERKWITKITSLKSKYPNEVTIKVAPEENNGVLLADIPKYWLRIQPPKKMNFTEEQRAAASERLSKAREAKKNE